MNCFKEDNGVLFFKHRQELMKICAWGEGLRVRATENINFFDKEWALNIPAGKNAEIIIGEDYASIKNGKIKAVVSAYGKLQFYNHKDELILKEFYRSWDYDIKDWRDLDQIVMMRTAGRSYKNVGGDNYMVHVKFESDEYERIYGMGQYQQPYLNLKGCSLEMAQKNTQATVPFCVSSKGYGILWNNPAIGHANFCNNITEFKAESTKQIDYWIVADDTPAAIVEHYCDVTGKVPMMPDYAMGFWQCKLRYMTQDEILKVAREYYQRKIPVKVMVVDFFHWPHQGDWKFDQEYWPNPKAMIDELHSMGMKLMVSVWPTIEDKSENSQEMQEKDLVIRANRGINYVMGSTRIMDATNPDAQRYVWEKCKKNYYDLGVDLFWLDEAEPEYTNQDFDVYRFYEGSVLECGNLYPVGYAKGFYDGMKDEGVENPINLIRCAWAGSQRYGALVWSGDVPSTFTYLKYQIKAGLNMGMAGIAWWTADIGGFHGANIYDPNFHELIMRWFQFGTFCPTMRLHGDRDPHNKPMGTSGGGIVASGADNEVWSYGKEVEAVMVKYIHIRERMQPYIKSAMKEAHENGTPVIKPLFYDFPEDKNAWIQEEAYLFGHDLLVSPIVEAGVTTQRVYLPEGAVWTEVLTGIQYEGGQSVLAQAPVNEIPLFVKDDSNIIKLLINHS